VSRPIPPQLAELGADGEALCPLRLSHRERLLGRVLGELGVGRSRFGRI
jgi:hypothetical protein